MQRRPFRYELPVNDAAHQLPAGKILHFTEHRNSRLGAVHRVEVWVEVAINGDDFLRDPITGAQHVQIIGTGHPIPDGAEHLASCLDGPLVWHLYRLKESS